MAPDRRATPRRGATGAPRPAPASRLRPGSPGAALRHRDGENPHLVNPLLDFPDSRRGDQLIQFGLRPAAHDPGLALSMAGERASNQLELRMPRLAGVDQESAL